MNIVVILPTYNERENILPLIRALRAQFTKIPHDMSILVVDDNSPDGTAEAVRRECSRSSNLVLITGQKQGLGAAYIRGMKFAVDNLRADIVMEMDADFSHKPEDVPRLIEAIDQGADFAIGSRYVPGGTIPVDWGLLRRMISQWGNVFARYIAGLYLVRDCTAGFRAIRCSLVKRIDLDSLKVRGYSFQIALLYEAIIHHGIVREIPVNFVDRKRGKTKLGISDIAEFMMNVWWIRFERSKNSCEVLLGRMSRYIVNLWPQ